MRACADARYERRKEGKALTKGVGPPVHTEAVGYGPFLPLARAQGEDPPAPEALTNPPNSGKDKSRGAKQSTKIEYINRKKEHYCK